MKFWALIIFAPCECRNVINTHLFWTFHIFLCFWASLKLLVSLTLKQKKPEVTNSCYWPSHAVEERKYLHNKPPFNGLNRSPSFSWCLVIFQRSVDCHQDPLSSSSHLLITTVLLFLCALALRRSSAPCEPLSPGFLPVSPPWWMCTLASTHVLTAILGPLCSDSHRSGWPLTCKDKEERTCPRVCKHTQRTHYYSWIYFPLWTFTSIFKLGYVSILCKSWTLQQVSIMLTTL